MNLRPAMAAAALGLILAGGVAYAQAKAASDCCCCEDRSDCDCCDHSEHRDEHEPAPAAAQE